MYIYKSKDVDLETCVMIDSATLQVGDVCMLTAKGVEAADDAANPIYGLVTGIVTKKGVPLDQATVTTDYDGTWTSSTQEYAAAADNDTDKMVAAIVHPLDGSEILSAELDATAATTTGSNVPGYYISVLSTDSSKLDEDTAHATNRLQFRLVDNGKGESSAQCPQRGGNFVLVRVGEVDVPRSAQA